MADDPASDDLPRGFSRDVLAVAVLIAGVAVAAAVTIEKPFSWVADVLFPYPLIALVAAAPIAWIAAWLRHAPARSRTGLLVPWPWVIARFGVMVALSCLMMTWIVAALIGASVAFTLLQAFGLVAVARVIFFVAEQCAIDLKRAIRGPVRAGS